jgi:hypothetical protein
MAELDPLEVRLTAAVRAFADRADTKVDAAAVAGRAIGRRRFGSLAWLGQPLPASAAILVTLALLLALLAWSAQVGAPGDPRGVVAPLPVSTASRSPEAAQTLAPTTTPVPSTPGTGDQHVTGTETGVILATGYTSTTVGDVTQLRGGVITAIQIMNDRRVTGDATFRFSVDAHANVGPEWGTYRLENADGAWEGPCSGASWDAGNAADGTCWLTGSGAYTGFTYYFHHTYGLGDSTNVDGIIFPGAPPKP